jgi:NAD(P)-dependent dehydrogenase (short-subunit alcohol dehydrogenase family)
MHIGAVRNGLGGGGVTQALTGRSAIITGGSHGLGLAIARAYLDAGANVFLCARDEDSLEPVRLDLQSAYGARVATAPADVSRPGDVQEVVARAIDAFSRIHVLVNNAGIQGPVGRLDQVDWDEWEYTVHVNLLGSVLCCRAILPHFFANGYGKIIQLSGGGATSPRPFFSAYAASKAAVVRFTETLAHEVRESQIYANAIAPGVLNTRLLDQIAATNANRFVEPVDADTVGGRRESCSLLNLAARLAVFLGSPASDGISGKLISAPWDPWDCFADLKHELAESDVYTLRRIVPADRGLDWNASDHTQGSSEND